MYVHVYVFVYTLAVYPALLGENKLSIEIIHALRMTNDSHFLFSCQAYSFEAQAYAENNV